MHELGAQTVSVGDIHVDFRRPFPSLAKPVERAPVQTDKQTGELVEVYDTEPPDPFETYWNTPLSVPTLKK